MPINVVLYQPEIPSNTGNIGRTCVATNTTLHLIKPLGFSTDDKMLRRAGLDYWKLLNVVYHESLEDFLEYSQGGAYYLLTKFGQKPHTTFDYSDVDEEIFFIFGKETTGLPDWFKEKYMDTTLRIPMTDKVRSLNLSNTAAILIYEALRQQGYPNIQ